MNQLSDNVSETVKQLGMTFLLAFYLPAAVFVFIQAAILIPIWNNTQTIFTFPDNPFPALWLKDLNVLSLVLASFVPLLIAIILAGLNNQLIGLLEGKFWWLKWGLLYPIQRFNLKRCNRLYSRLLGLQREYIKVSTRLTEEDSEDDRKKLRQELTGLAQNIEREHELIEKACKYQRIPHDPNRILPTAFGNAYAIAEEYSYEHYGIDAVLFWPRLRELMLKDEIEHSDQISRQIMILNLLINFFILWLIITFETLITFKISPNVQENILLDLLAVSAFFTWSYYTTSVSAVRMLGELIKTSFDLYRGLILKGFGLKTSGFLASEQIVWVKLAAFIRRGDEFYFPTEDRNESATK